MDKISGILARATRVALLVVVVGAPVSASWHGLVAVGHQWLDLGVWSPLVPLTLDAAALYVAVLSRSATLKGDSAGVDRLLLWVYAALSSGLNVWFADVIGGMQRAAFYGVASLSAAVLWERTLRALRRQELRALGAIDSPAPRYRLLRWLLHTRETWGAWRLAIGEGLSDASAAIQLYRAPVEDRDELAFVLHLRAQGVSEAEIAALVRKRREEVEADRRQERAAELEDQAVTAPPLPQASEQNTPKRDHAKPAAPKPATSSKPTPVPVEVAQVPDAFDAIAAELAELSQPEALERAFDALGDDRFEDVPAARTWLADRGFQTDRSGAYKVAKKLRAERAPRLAVVGEDA